MAKTIGTSRAWQRVACPSLFNHRAGIFTMHFVVCPHFCQCASPLFAVFAPLFQDARSAAGQDTNRLTDQLLRAITS